MLGVADRSACAIAVDANMRGDDPDVRDELDAMVRAPRPERTIARMGRRQSDGRSRWHDLLARRLAGPTPRPLLPAPGH